MPHKDGTSALLEWVIHTKCMYLCMCTPSGCGAEQYVKLTLSEIWIDFIEYRKITYLVCVLHYVKQRFLLRWPFSYRHALNNMLSYRTFKLTHDTVHVGVFNYIFIASAEFTQEIYHLTDPFYGLNLTP